MKVGMFACSVELSKVQQWPSQSLPLISRPRQICHRRHKTRFQAQESVFALVVAPVAHLAIL